MKIILLLIIILLISGCGDDSDYQLSKAKYQESHDKLMSALKARNQILEDSIVAQLGELAEIIDGKFTMAVDSSDTFYIYDKIQVCDTIKIEVSEGWVFGEIIWNADTLPNGHLPPCPSSLAEVEWIAKRRYKHKTIQNEDSTETTIYYIDSLVCKLEER